MEKSALIEQSLYLLTRMFDEKNQLFSFSTSLKNGNYSNKFGHNAAYRYSINAFAALQKLGQFSKTGWNVESLVDNYLVQHLKNDINVANRGLLLHVMSLMNHERSGEIYTWLAKRLDTRTQVLQYSLQDIAWASIGITTYTHRYGNDASFAKRILNHLQQDFMNPITLLPKFDQSMRGTFVSFGGDYLFFKGIRSFFKNIR